MTGFLDDALVCFERSLKAKPDRFQAYNNVGIPYQARGTSRPQSWHTRRRLRSPGYAEAHVNSRNVLQQMGNWGQSIECYEPALALPRFGGSGLQSRKRAEGDEASGRRCTVLPRGRRIEARVRTRLSRTRACIAGNGRPCHRGVSPRWEPDFAKGPKACIRCSAIARRFDR